MLQLRRSVRSRVTGGNAGSYLRNGAAGTSSAAPCAVDLVWPLTSCVVSTRLFAFCKPAPLRDPCLSVSDDRAVLAGWLCYGAEQLDRAPMAGSARPRDEARARKARRSAGALTISESADGGRVDMARGVCGLLFEKRQDMIYLEGHPRVVLHGSGQLAECRRGRVRHRSTLGAGDPLGAPFVSAKAQ